MRSPLASPFISMYPCPHPPLTGPPLRAASSHNEWSGASALSSSLLALSCPPSSIADRQGSGGGGGRLWDFSIAFSVSDLLGFFVLLVSVVSRAIRIRGRCRW